MSDLDDQITATAQADTVIAETGPAATAEAQPVIVPAQAPARRTATRRKPAAAAAPVPVAKPARKMPTPKTTKPAKTAPAPKTPSAVASPAPAKASAPIKETPIMTTTIDYTEKFTTAMKDAQEKAKAALEKSQASLGEMGTFTKGNVEALVESTKIFATGLQELSKGYMTESKAAFETLTAEIKEMAAVKTPAELMEKQSTLLRKQFDAAVAVSSKNSEAMLKLASEAFQPISNRVSLAVEKIKHAA